MGYELYHFRYLSRVCSEADHPGSAVSQGHKHTAKEKDRIDNLIVNILNQWNDAARAFLKHENVDENADKLYNLMGRISDSLRRSQKDPMSNIVHEFCREFDKE